MTNEERAKAAIAKLPDMMRIGHLNIAIVRMNHREADRLNAYGQYRGQEYELAIEETIRSPEKVVEVVIHEITHGIMRSLGMLEEDKDKEERFVMLCGIGWTLVYRDNSWLLPWISETLSL